MKPKYFPLSVLIWTMGFSTFAQTDCLPLQIDHGLHLRIGESSVGWINLWRHDNRNHSLENSPEQLILDEFARSRFFHKVKYSVATDDISGCVGNCVANIGFDCLRGNIWHFDFDGMKLCKVRPDEMRSFEKNGYSKVPAKITADWIAIEIEIRRQRHKAHLDFWFDGLLMLKSDSGLPFFKEGHSRIRTIDGDIREYSNMAIKFNETFYSGTVLLGDDNKIGIGFINGFNWLIDMRTRSVYVKKNGRSIDPGSGLKTKVLVKSGMLVIAASDQSQPQFNPGDVIEKIDSTLVTAENACEWALRLNESSSWRNFAIEILNRKP